MPVLHRDERRSEYAGAVWISAHAAATTITAVIKIEEVFRAFWETAGCGEADSLA